MGLSSLKLSITIQVEEVEKGVPVALLEGTLEEKLRKAADFGADGIELMTVNPLMVDYHQIRSYLSRYSLEVSAIASGGLAFTSGITLLNTITEKAIQAEARLRDMITLSAALNAPLVTIGSFRGRAAGIEGNGQERLADIIRSNAEYAQGNGVRLAVEPLNRYEADLINNVQEGLAFLEVVDHPAVGLLLDTYHINIEECSWTEPFHKALSAGVLFHVHLGDNTRNYPGSGLIDFPSILDVLRNNGYRGFLSAELLPNPDPDTAARNTIAYMRSIMEA